MPAFLVPILAGLGKVPWQVWVAAAFIALLPLSYCKGYNDGKDVILERLEKAEQKAKEEAAAAAASADEKQQEKAKEFEATQDALKKEIEDAKANDSNALDALFGGVPAD